MTLTSEPITEPGATAVTEICDALRPLLADVFALYVKTKNFHWHISGRHFRDYHLLLDEQAEQIFAMTDAIAERARKLGGRRCDLSATSRAISACATTMPHRSARSTCCVNFETTIGN